MGDAHDPARAVPATLIFIAGFTTVFAGLGAIAGAAGLVARDVPETACASSAVSLIIVMGLALLGVARGPLSRERRLIPTLPKVTGRRAALRRGRRVRRGLEPVRRARCSRPRSRSRRVPASVGRGTILLVRVRDGDRRAVPRGRARARVVAAARRATAPDRPEPRAGVGRAPRRARRVAGDRTPTCTSRRTWPASSPPCTGSDRRQRRPSARLAGRDRVEQLGQPPPHVTPRDVPAERPRCVAP